MGSKVVVNNTVHVGAGSNAKQMVTAAVVAAAVTGAFHTVPATVRFAKNHEFHPIETARKTRRVVERAARATKRISGQMNDSALVLVANTATLIDRFQTERSHTPTPVGTIRVAGELES